MPLRIYETYMSLPAPIMQCDYFRYIVLYVLGGIYTDVDTALVRPLSRWEGLNTDAQIIVGIEVIYDTKEEALKQWLGTQLQFIQWTFAVSPRHPTLRKIIDHIAFITTHLSPVWVMLEIEKNRRSKDQLVMAWCGPYVWTQIILHFIKKNYTQGDLDRIIQSLQHVTSATKIHKNIYVYPQKAFYFMYVHHHLKGTWKAANLKQN